MADPDLKNPFLQDKYSYLGKLRPLGSGEYVKNSDGSWSSEYTATVQDPTFNNGKPTLIPRLWVKNGKPIILDEDQAIDAASKSNLIWPSFNTIKDAEKFANDRESSEQSMKPDQWKPLWKEQHDLTMDQIMQQVIESLPVFGGYR